jgi:hypothetical protein
MHVSHSEEEVTWEEVNVFPARQDERITVARDGSSPLTPEGSLRI